MDKHPKVSASKRELETGGGCRLVGNVNPMSSAMRPRPCSVDLLAAFLASVRLPLVSPYPDGAQVVYRLGVCGMHSRAYRPSDDRYR